MASNAAREEGGKMALEEGSGGGAAGEESTEPSSSEVVDEALVNAAKAMELAQNVFVYALEDELAGDRAALREKIMAEIQRNNMAPYYEIVCKRLQWSVDAALLEKMRAANEAELKRLDEVIKDAKENQGEVEVADAMNKRAAYFGLIGDKDKAFAAYAEVPEKPLSTGQKIDVAMACVRISFVHGDLASARKQLAKAKELNETGGDWDRRNRLKVYEGAYAIMQRDFEKASRLLLDSIATFTAAEMFKYDHFIFLTCLVCLRCVDRPTLKKKVIDSPDVISVMGEVPHLRELLTAFYEGRYADFFRALTSVYPSIARDMVVAQHASFYLREMRVAAYTQFLESYKSITLAGMARSFGVSTGFLDKELSRFIAAGRLNAKIDGVANIVETTRPDAKNAQYHAVIKQGDALLNKVQKLSRVVAI